MSGTASPAFRLLKRFDATPSPKPFSAPTYKKKSAPKIGKAACLHGIAGTVFGRASLADGSTTDDGMAAIPIAIRSAKPATAPRKTGTRWLFAAAATRN